MLETLYLLLFNILAIAGFNRITEYGHDVDKNPVDKEALWFIRFYATKYLGIFSKPICTCVVCMSSLHSVYIFWPHHSLDWYNFYLWGVYMLALAGLAVIYERLFA